MKMASRRIGRLSSGRKQENFNLAIGSHALKGSGSQQPRTAFPAAMIAKREPTLGEVGLHSMRGWCESTRSVLTTTVRAWRWKSVHGDSRGSVD